MNKDNARDYLPLVQALAEGKTIQFKESNNEWFDVEFPNFMLDFNRYRIKPEPKKQSFRVALFKDHKESIYYHDTTEKVNDKIIERTTNFVRWLTDRIEYELPEGE